MPNLATCVLQSLHLYFSCLLPSSVPPSHRDAESHSLYVRRRPAVSEKPTLCRICGQPVDLTFDNAADEDGQTVHEHCYVSKIVGQKVLLQKDKRELLDREYLVSLCPDRTISYAAECK